MDLFDTKSTSPVSDVFVLGEGEVALLQAFNLANSQRAVVQRVRFTDGYVPSGNACKETMCIPPSKIALVEDITQCGVWALNPCQNVALLAIPGVYRLALDDGEAEKEVAPGVPIPVAKSTAVGTAIIQMTRLSTTHAAIIPKDLFFGAVTGCHGCN
ncbi:hypothetical protein V757_11445 [Pelistega indica]|uniref:Uncharacterized protein n=1 Tax=Pelistega indica TaxID=1414851 RepID=V8FVJ3_9BURK|nr:hypothetical protein [Pelistega indica]ETD67432.1 hypothetical protein V757_11445 [Pelistega indica]